jgi:hypothetical protein
VGEGSGRKVLPHLARGAKVTETPPDIAIVEAVSLVLAHK